MSNEQQSKKIAEIIAKCWADESFKQRLLTDTRAALAGEGLAIPAGLEVKALENTATVFHLVLPRKPSDLSDEDLSGISAGRSCYGPEYGDDDWYKALGG